MSLTENVIEGILKPDGTLELDEKPSLLPGRVIVILQSAQAKLPRHRGLTAVIDEIRREQQAQGYPGRSAKEIEDGLRECDEKYEMRMQTLLSQIKSGVAGGS